MTSQLVSIVTPGHVPLDLDLPLHRITGIGPRQAQRLEKLGLSTVRDLLFHLPRRYEDTRATVPLRALQPGIVQTSHVRVRNVSSRRSPYKKMVLVEATLEDDGAVATAVWFNQPFLGAPAATRDGDDGQRQGRDLEDRTDLSQPGLRARRAATSTMSARSRRCTRRPRASPRVSCARVSSRCSGSRPRSPTVCRRRSANAEGLMPIAEALYQVHVPDSLATAARARERIAFEELFLLQVAAERARRRRLSGPGVIVAYDIELARRFVATLPFKLTDGQRVAGHEILTDLAAPGPMNRLLQGDVGSGKTVVAALAALMTHHAGFQTAVMAPTEILARQHHATLDTLLAGHGLPPRLLVGSTSAAARREILAGLAGGHDSLIVGTHALIEDDVAMDNLGLVVVDEQHRFGVAQRQPSSPDLGSDAQLPRHDRDADPALAVEHAVRRRRPQRAARDAARPPSRRDPRRPAGRARTPPTSSSGPRCTRGARHSSSARSSRSRTSSARAARPPSTSD